MVLTSVDKICKKCILDDGEYLMEIQLLDGSKKVLEDNATAMSLAESISRSLAKNAVAAKINDELKDITTKLKDGDIVNIITNKDEEAVGVIRHSAAHMLAQAVKRLYKDVKIAIGPQTEDGFFYDFDSEHRFTEKNIAEIEKEMVKIRGEALKIERYEISASEAIEKFSKANEPYKVEIIKDLKDEKVSIYKQGEFEDLCRGPHVNRTSEVNHFKILSVAGAYWKGSEKNKMLQRIYGTLFMTKEEIRESFRDVRAGKKAGP